MPKEKEAEKENALGQESEEGEVEEKKEKKKGGFDILTPLGLFLGIAFIILSMLWNGDWKFKEVARFFDRGSVLIVIGGVIAALMVSFRSDEIIFTLKHGNAVVNRKQKNLEELVEMFVEFSRKSRKNGFLSLEEDLEELEDPFIKKGIELILSGASEEEVKEILTNELDVEIEQLSTAPAFYSKMAELGPGFGMIGTLIGLIIMLGKLDDVSSLGPAMAVALITTFYGSLIANLFASPMMNKINRSIDLLYNEKAFIIEAICELQKNPTPSKLRVKLGSYVPKKAEKKKKKDKNAEVADENEQEKEDESVAS